MGGAVDWAKNNAGRIGADIATGGQYETYRALSGQGSVYDKIPGVSGALDSMKPANTGGVQGAAGDAKTIQDQFLQQYKGLQPGQAPTIDTTQADQFRQQQMGLVGQLNGVINGTAPSVAAIQQQQAFGQQQAQQAGMAAAMGRGGNQALAMRTAMTNTGQLGAQQAAASALLRAQETTAARGQLGDVTAAGRGADLNTASANQTGAINTRSQDIQQQIGLGSLTNQANANQVNAQVGALNAETAKKQQEGNLLSTGLAIAPMLSDERAKDDIAPESSGDIRSFLAAIHPASYRYKGSDAPHVGVIAQDVERSPVGRTMVHETPAGKAIDIPSATGALLAALSDMHRRVARLEGGGG